MFASIISDTARQFGVDWPHFLAQCISFSIVLFLLHRFAYKPILQILEERRQRIKEGLENAERIKAELAKTEAARQEALNQANNRPIASSRRRASRRPKCLNRRPKRQSQQPTRSWPRRARPAKPSWFE